MKTQFFLALGIIITSVIGYGQTNTVPASGNVGIGTLNPTATLDVNGRMKVDSSLVVKDSVIVDKDIRTKNRIIVDGESILKGDVVAKEDLKVNGDTRIQGDAKVEGTTKLIGDAIIEGNLKVPNIQDAGNNALTNGSAKFVLSNSNGALRTGNIDMIAHAIYEPKLCDPGPIANPVWSNGENKIFVNCPQVNVGINTTAPRVNLDVIGTAYAQRLALSTDPLNFNEKLRIGGFSPANNSKLFVIHNTANDLLSLTNQGIMNLNGQFVMTSLNNTPLIIQSSSEKLLQLESDGLLRSRRIKIDQDSWADFVFEENYELLSIDSLEVYIQKNKHLPDVPSTSEVNANGVEIAEINTLLLQKVEELVLYTIQQEKEIQNLKKEIGRINEAEKSEILDDLGEQLKQQQKLIEELQQELKNTQKLED